MRIVDVSLPVLLVVAAGLVPTLAGCGRKGDVEASPAPTGSAEHTSAKSTAPPATAASAAIASCDVKADGSCVEYYATPDLDAHEKNCKGIQKGNFTRGTSACSTDGIVATCSVQTKTRNIKSHYYASAKELADARQACSSMLGTWTTN